MAQNFEVRVVFLYMGIVLSRIDVSIEREMTVMAVGEKVKQRIMDVPENLKQTMSDVKDTSVYDAVSNQLTRFGKSNRKLLQR